MQQVKHKLEAPSSPTGIVTRLQKWILAPPTQAGDFVERQQIRLLTIILFIFAPLTAAGILSSLNREGGVTLFQWTLFVGSTIGYLLSRTKYYRWGAWFVLTIFAAAPFLTVLYRLEYYQQNFLSVFAWIIIAFLLGSILLSLPEMVSFVLFTSLAMIMLATFHASIVFTDLISSIGFVISSGLLTVLVMRHRNQIEAYRLDELQRQQTSLEKLNQELESLLFIISHDLKEPLRGIENFSDILNLRYEQALDKRGQDYLARVSKASVRMRHLIEDILSLSRIRNAELKTKEMYGDQIVQKALDQLRPQLEAAKGAVQVGENLPMLRLHEMYGVQALCNLISNAIKYSMNGAPPQIEIEDYQGIGFVVRDRGMGVPADQRERIFELFQRGVDREVEGTGAGLAIVRQIARQHGGAAWMQPREGGGSEFIVTFAPAAD